MAHRTCPGRAVFRAEAGPNLRGDLPEPGGVQPPRPMIDRLEIELSGAGDRPGEGAPGLGSSPGQSWAATPWGRQVPAPVLAEPGASAAVDAILGAPAEPGTGENGEERLDPVELGAWLLPGWRASAEGDGLLAEILLRFSELPQAGRSALLAAWSGAHGALLSEAPRAARRLTLALRVLDRPDAWPAKLAGPGVQTLVHGLADATEPAGDTEFLAALCEPAWTLLDEQTIADTPILPTQRDGSVPLTAGERERLIQLLTDAASHPGANLRERPAQIAVAREVATTLGSGELALVHAPTGTGKTLGYLLPILAFASKNDLRTGVATYTRALQRQAFERDVPIALAMLERSGWRPMPRVALLKGRPNYLCWRALLAASPTPSDTAARWLAYSHLLAYALISPDGDLEQLPRWDLGRFLLAEGVDGELEGLLRLVSAETACCTRTEDRRTCGAESARRRAERSHVVLTNHAFALARREFVRHVVFDECEHLHDQAHNAFSHTLPLSRLLAELEALGTGSGRKRRVSALLERLGRAAGPGSESERLVGRALEARDRAIGQLRRLTDACERFLLWREERLAERKTREAHSLLREYVENRRDESLVSTHLELGAALNAIAVALAGLAELLDDLPLTGRGRLRFRLDRTRTTLEERSAGLAAFLPRVDAEVRFAPETFYDVERHPRRGLILAARVLLPNEYLGRFYHPDLADAVFLSATTHLRGGFETSSAYLGLDRACDPREDEPDFAPRTLRTLRADESFDYRRVLVAVPRGLPAIAADKSRWLDAVIDLVERCALELGGRTLCLFTNSDDGARVGRELQARLAPHDIESLWQGQPGTSSEQLADRFRSNRRAVLCGLDTFWFGADFPGDDLLAVVIAKLPYGVPDRYHHAQCASIGDGPQRKRIYMPRALARFRQGFGRLMRRADDRGVVFVLDARVLDPRHRIFLGELPLDSPDRPGARLVRGDIEQVLGEAFAHLNSPAEPNDPRA